MGEMTLRFVRSSDAARILEIYAPYVLNAAVSFETDLPSVPEFMERIRSISVEYPYIVCEEDGRVIGYAYAHRLLERAAYQWDAELSVYVDSSYQRNGIGRTMYRFLFEALKLQNVHTVYAIITADNATSLTMHEALCFRTIGTFRNTGYKLGVWHDVIWLDKPLLAYSASPKALKPISEVDSAALDALLDRFTQELNR